MNEHIIFKQDDDGRIIKILPSGYDDENMLKRLIKEYPTLLPTPTHTSSERIFTLTDEYPIDGGGSIDLLCVDNEGNIYIVETKLQKNSDRRTIIAQLLDYASQMAKESFDTFKRKIEERTGESIDKILGEDTDIVNSIKQSLDEKRFVLIVCMDNIEQRLKDVIIHL
jgi:predicted metal-dependent hydrolase